MDQHGRDALVSILTPAYNHASVIGACLGSVRSQDYGNWEQIVIDDGSTDGTQSVVERHADARLRYERQEHVGIWRLADTYNRALALARGTLIAILEGDDLWTPHHLDRLAPGLADPEVVLSYGRTALYANNAPLKHVIPDERFRRTFGRSALLNSPVGAATYAMLHRRGLTYTYPCAVLIRRDALEAIGGFQHVEGLGTADYPTFLRLSLRGPFAYTDEVVAYWRRHAGATSALIRMSMYARVRDFALEFARGQAADVLTPKQRSEIERSWEELPARLALHAGRTRLLRGAWAESRRDFARALRTREPMVFGAALAGLVASWLRRDIEGLVRISGRADLRSTAFDPQAADLPPQADS